MTSISLKNFDNPNSLSKYYSLIKGWKPNKNEFSPPPQ